MYPKAKIGFFSVGLEAYWPQFDGMKDSIFNNHDVLQKKLSSFGDVCSAGLVDNEAKSRQAGALFKTKGVDIVFCFTATYSTSNNLIFAVLELGVPVIFLNLQAVEVLDFDNITEIGDWLKNCTCAGLPEMTATMVRNGIVFDVITGMIHDDELADQEIEKWCKAAQVKRLLKQSTVGMLGHAYDGMMDLYFDRTNFLNKLGVNTAEVGYDELCDLMKDIDQTEISEASKDILSSFEHAGITEDRISDAAQVFVALKNLIRQKGLQAISFHHKGRADADLEKVVATSNISFSMCTTNGVPCCVEGDVKACVASLILKALSGACELTELYSMDFRDDVCIVGHSGSGDQKISKSKPLLKETSVFHGKTGGGFLTQFYVEKGPVTLLALTQNANGDYKMVAAQGECVEGPLLKLGDTNSRIRFDGGLRNFVNEWSRQGPSHHCVMTTGHWGDELDKVAKMLNAEIVNVV